VLIKICGTTTEDDALLAVALGATAIGFVFAPSKRQMAPAAVADIVKRLPRGEVLTVGVFRDESPQRVVEILEHTGLEAAQLHGHEGPDASRWIRERVRMVIKAFAAGDPAVRDADEWGADAILLDAPTPGSGEVFDWAMAGELPQGQRLIVAGGLNPENVADAVARTRPWGVDVASGVERAPGRKDPMKLKAFIEAARRAASALEETNPTRTAPPAGFGPYDWQEEH
jgi:phosphoribosylanthranilate isomerase